MTEEIQFMIFMIILTIIILSMAGWLYYSFYYVPEIKEKRKHS